MQYKHLLLCSICIDISPKSCSDELGLKILCVRMVMQWSLSIYLSIYLGMYVCMYVWEGVMAKVQDCSLEVTEFEL